MKFSIRDVLWLTVVVALAVGWTIDRVRLHQAELRTRMEVQRVQYMAEIARASAQMERAAAAISSTTAP